MLSVHALYLVAIGISLVSLLIIVARLSRLDPWAPAGGRSVAVILPLTGESPSFEALLDALNKQTLQPACLLVAVESEQDPAYARVRSLMHQASFPIKLVVAGLATHQAQKCRNQQAALDSVAPGTEIIVLMDGDILPSPLWLGRLVWPVACGKYDIVSAHRWQRVEAQRLGAHLIAAVDRSITLLPRVECDFARVAWGGSIAMTAETARFMDLHALLASVLSDDLALARRASDLGLRLGTHRSLLVASPNRQSLVPAWYFARRQYQMCRIYRPALWGIGVGIVGGRVLGWSAAIWLSVVESSGIWGLSTLILLGLLKQHMTGKLSGRVGMPDPPAVHAMQLALGALQPIVDLFHLSVMIGACWTRSVRWGHVTYRVWGPENVRVQARVPFGDSRPFGRDNEPNLDHWELAEMTQSGTEKNPL